MKKTMKKLKNAVFEFIILCGIMIILWFLFKRDVLKNDIIYSIYNIIISVFGIMSGEYLAYRINRMTRYMKEEKVKQFIIYILLFVAMSVMFACVCPGLMVVIYICFGMTLSDNIMTSFISVGLSIPIMLAVISFIELLITNIRKKKGK